MSETIVTIDFETRSTVDLPKTGAYVYGESPDTSVLCLANNLSGDPLDTELWTPLDGFPQYREPLTPLLDHIHAGGLVEAHNSYFEWCIWNLVGVRDYGWPELPLRQLRCSASKARYNGLPGSLDHAGSALNLDTQKDKRGKQLITLLCKPRRVTKNNPDKWNNDPALFQELFDYCIRDVDTEMELSNALVDLPPEELEIWLLDQEMNHRGVYIDISTVDKIIDMMEGVIISMNEEISDLTLGMATSATQVGKIKTWCEEEDFPILGLTKPEVERYLVKPNIPDDVKRVLEIRQTIGKTSTAKYRTMKMRMCSDGRIRETVIYHKAHCVTGDTEVLTRDGWESIESWGGGEIAQYEPDDKNICFLPADKFEGGIEEDWIRVKSNYLDLDMTLGHSMPMLDYSHNKVFKSMQAAEVFSHWDKKLHICSGIFTDPESENSLLADCEVQFCVMMQADGSISNGGKSIRFRLKKQRKVLRCKTILKECGITYTETMQDDCHCFYLPYDTCVDWMFRSKHFGNWLLEFNQHQRNVFIDELRHWDGKFDASPNISSADKNNVDWVQIVCHLSNRRTTKISSYTDGRTGKTIWGVGVVKRTEDYFTFKRHQMEKIKEPQKTFCTSTSTGWWVARRNGRIFITGNTGRWGGTGIQTQNFPRPVIDVDPDFLIKVLRNECA